MKRVSSPSDWVPDLEDLAAYLDGLLSDDQRQAVEARLADDEDYNEVFLETVRFRDEEGLATVTEKASVMAFPGTGPAPGRFSWVVPLAAAAMLILTVGIWRPWQVSIEDRFLATVDAQTSAEAAFEHERAWSIMRSGLPTSYRSEAEEGFRLGTYLVDLKLAWLAEDRRMTTYWLQQIDHSYQQLGMWDTTLRLLRKDLEEDVPWEVLQKRFPRLESDLHKTLKKGSVEERAVTAGRWSELVLLATLGGQHNLLKRLVDEMPEGLRASPEAKEPLSNLRRAAERLDNDPHAAADVLKAQGEIEEILGG